MALRTLPFLGVALCAFPIGLASRAGAGAAQLPPDLRAFVDHRTRCDEWSVKAMDPARGVESESGWRVEKCADLAEDQRALLAKYAGDPKILAAFNAVRRIIVVRVPVQIAPDDRPSESDR
jgi:hypothetical protein